VEPPGPKGLPILGHLLEIRRNILGFFTDCARRYGDVVAARVGPWPAVLLSNPADLEDVLVGNAGNFRKPRLFWQQVTAIFGNGLLTSEGCYWLRQRRLAAPAFAGQRLSAYAAVMVGHTERMLDR
jgi:cytochrome P450